MNKYEKEVQKALLDNEKEILEELEKTYTKALATIKSRINELQGKSEELTQSQIYQLNFQKNLEKQVSAIIDLLKQDIKTKTNTYLTKVYENSFIGESYNLYKSYKMSTIIGIDQQNVINIVTKPIENMTFAERTDVNMNEFKKAVKSEISRGFSTGMSYAQMAQIISSSAERSMYKSYRIARTEGLRVQSESKINYANSIKQKYGADLVKQWDSTLDGKTRPEHQELDGQIKELDEKFKCSGGETDAPGLFGNPVMDCNCRCCLTHIPRWAINTPLSKIDNANPFKDDGSVNLIDGKNYNEYKKNYYSILQNSKSDDIIKEIITLDDFPKEFKTNKEIKNTTIVMDYINNNENANPKIVKLYKNINNVAKLPFKISHAKEHSVAVSYSSDKEQKIKGIKLTIPNLELDDIGKINIWLHENMHFIDFMINNQTMDKYKGMISTTKIGLKSILQTTKNKTIGNDIKVLFDKYNQEYKNIRDETVKQYSKRLNSLADEFKEKTKGVAWTRYSKVYKDYIKEDKKIRNELEEVLDVKQRNLMGCGIPELQDIYDALSGGEYRDTGIVKYGHGSKTYSSINSRIKEIVANYSSLSITRPDLIELLKKDKPDLVNELDKLIDEMIK